MKEHNDIQRTVEDILRDGPHKRPYGVPSDYMSSLSRRLESIPQSVPAPRRFSIWERILPYVSVAAAFLVMVTVGGTILRKTAVSTPSQDEIMEFAYIERANILFMEEEAEDLSFEDIEEYLVSSGISSEHLTYTAQNYEQ